MLDGQFTLGVEEEFQIVHPETRELRSYVSKIMEERDKTILRERVRAEMHQSMVETGTGICQSVSAVRAELIEMSSELDALARKGGLRIIAASTHPISDWKTQEITAHERYDKIVEDLQDVARANLVFGLHVHVAEDGADVEDAQRRGYPGPLERLLALDALPRGSLLAHGVHLTEAQVRRADEAGLWLVQNPRSNEGNRVGYGKALRASGHVALGTDGWPAEMDVEAAALGRLGREHGDPDAVLSARVDAGHALASQVFGVRLGALDVERAADVVVGLPGERPRHVVVDGRVVVKDGQLLTADVEALRAEARAAAPRLWARMG